MTTDASETTATARSTEWHRLPTFLARSAALRIGVLFGTAGAAFVAANLILAGFLPPDDYGTLVVAIVTLAGPIAPLGRPTIVLRERLPPHPGLVRQCFVTSSIIATLTAAAAAFRDVQAGLYHTLVPRLCTAADPAERRQLVCQQAVETAVLVVAIGVVLALAVLPLLGFLFPAKFHLSGVLVLAAVTAGQARVLSAFTGAAITALRDTNDLARWNGIAWLALLMGGAVGASWGLSGFLWGSGEARSRSSYPFPSGPADPRMTTATPRSLPTVPLLATQDLQAVLNLAAGTLAVWMVPERWWGSADRFIALQRLRFDRRWAARYRGRLTALLDPGPAASIDPIIVAYFGHLRTAKFQALRLRHLSGWRPTLRIEGRDHLEAALAARRGVILWVAPFIYASLVAKMTLHDAGFAAVQLSRYSHGFSRSRLGARLFNPIRTTVEDRFLAERVIIGDDGAVIGPLQTLVHRLQDNRFVSIAFGAAGKRPVRVPFLDGTIAVAGGAPGLAVKTGAALLPVVTLRGPDGGFTTVVEPMLVTPPTDRQGAVGALIVEMARRLEPYVLRSPDQFWWHSDIAESASVV